MIQKEIPIMPRLWKNIMLMLPTTHNMFKFWGKVKVHNKRGKKLGFPTANVILHQDIPEGIYISKTRIGGKEYKSLTFIGAAKTFAEKKFHAEAYILDFNKNIYDRWISINLIKKIRENKKFNSPEKLIAQMKKDEKETKAYFRLSKLPY